jgi:hypothetical protein
MTIIGLVPITIDDSFAFLAEIYLAQQKQKQQAKAMQLMAKQQFTSFTSEEKWREVDKEVGSWHVK